MTGTKVGPRTARTALMFAVVLVSAVVATQSAHGQTFSVLHTFHGPDGAQPYAGLIRDAAGNFYGTTISGGPHGGTVFKLGPTGKETVLFSFRGGNTGNLPYAGVVRDSRGNLYGTTTSTPEVVYKVTPRRKFYWLHKFRGRTDGNGPGYGSLLLSAGKLYGTTAAGGAHNQGTVFKCCDKGNDTILYSFNFGTGDGGQPIAGLIQDAAGNFYGTTVHGGGSNECGGGGCGTVFKLDTTGTETVLYSFTGGSDGAAPYAGLIQDAAGNLYGTTWQRGALGYGTVFKLDPSGAETTLYSFTGGTDGGSPRAGLVQDAVGNLYGTTQAGGDLNGCRGDGCGTVFKVDPDGTETVLYSFTGGTDGAEPNAGLLMDAAGNLYGTATFGGDLQCSVGSAYGCGVVFEIGPTMSIRAEIWPGFRVYLPTQSVSTK